MELMVGGLGFGLVIAPIAVAVLDHVRDDQKATGSAIVTVMRMMGMIVGLSALSSWGKDRFTSLVGRISIPFFPEGATQAVIDQQAARYEAQVADATLTFFHEVFIAAMAVCLLALIPAFFMGRKGRSDPGGSSKGDG